MADAAIFLCAGRSVRMRGLVQDKILAPLNGKPLFLYSLEAFAQSGVVEEIVFVYRNRAQRLKLAQIIADQSPPDLFHMQWVEGGEERRTSVFNALVELPEIIDYVFIHDCARPLIQPGILVALQKAVLKDKAVSLAHRIVDTVKEVETESKSLRQCYLKDIDRSRLWATETPQVFARELITQAYRKFPLNDTKVTDDTAVASYAGHRITLIETPFPNPKMTTPNDFAYAEFILQNYPQWRGKANL